jgi:hypothetical protein
MPLKVGSSARGCEEAMKYSQKYRAYIFVTFEGYWGWLTAD